MKFSLIGVSTAALVLVSLTGCKFGGSTVATLKSDPPGADAYMVPSTKWKEKSGASLNADSAAWIARNRDWLKDYWKGKTPVENTSVGDYNQIFVVIKGDRIEFREVVPIPKEWNVFSLDLK